MKKHIFVAVSLVYLVVAIASVFTATADPAPPLSLTPGASFRANFSTTGNNLSAQAGNLTELMISGVSVTELWQGYYGNVTGKLTLQDANNNTFYEWNLFSSTGEVYASNTSAVTWSNVQCVNFTGNSSEAINVTTLEDMFGTDATDPDGFDETFSSVYSGTFFVGAKKINGSNACPQANLFNSTGPQSLHFTEVLMTDNLSRSIIFTSLTEDNHPGFDGATWDFEMLVADNGHLGDTATTTYFFYVEMI